MLDVLSVFNTDNQNRLSSQELLKVLEYFSGKEKEIAISGKKGDGIITSKDIEEIIKTDPKFTELRKKFNDDSKVVDLLSNAIMSLSVLTNDEVKDFYADYISAMSLEFTVKTNGRRLRANPQYCLPDKVVSEVKEIDGKQVKVSINNRKESFVTTPDGQYIYTNPAYVAKILGYKSESTRFGLGPDRYYTEEPHDAGYGCSYYKREKVWNEDTNSFSNGKDLGFIRQELYMGAFLPK